MDDTRRSSNLWEDAGVFATQRGDVDEAVRYLEQALILAREHPEQRGVKGVLMALGYAHLRRGTDKDLRRADACYQEAIALHGGWEAFRAKVPFRQVNNVNALYSAFRAEPSNVVNFERTS